MTPLLGSGSRRVRGCYHGRALECFQSCCKAVRGACWACKRGWSDCGLRTKDAGRMHRQPVQCTWVCDFIVGYGHFPIGACQKHALWLFYLINTNRMLHKPCLHSSIVRPTCCRNISCCVSHTTACTVPRCQFEFIGWGWCVGRPRELLVVGSFCLLVRVGDRAVSALSVFSTCGVRTIRTVCGYCDRSGVHGFTLCALSVTFPPIFLCFIQYWQPTLPPTCGWEVSLRMRCMEWRGMTAHTWGNVAPHVVGALCGGTHFTFSQRRYVHAFMVQY
jgi:hypothetical protein